MKKVGIVSYHREANYGTMLQAYALAAAIKKCGTDCEYIDYYETLLPPAYISILRRCLSNLYHFLHLPSRGDFGFFDSYEFRGILKAFTKFHEKYIPLSKDSYYFNTLGDLEDKYEFFITGSDQTWSKAMNMNPYAINFLPFIKDYNKKRSYAPSMGTIHLDSDFKDTLIQELAKFSFASCRERPNCNALTPMIGHKIHYVVDPTLLLTKDDWNTIAIPPLIQGKYILAYILGTKKCISQFAEKIGREKSLPVYYIITRPEYLNKKNALNNVGPSEFLGLIRDAEYVVTDSFHGTIFSINYGVNFYSFNKRNNEDRISDNDRISVFLEELELSDRFRQDDDARISPDINYNNSTIFLNKLRDMSMQYLLSLLKK
ncbi:polysaccharide pyruvyl transferase family protein [Bacteroides bouchesdurhonensis]|uniref:polysaccharide pyruvyl transferase family protein n=1 Tax=Bacteroides bouchesdurhonensis TaxID=1841855 RepID=UPI001651E151|nr:polysaccharide pyruvyl transferase family protein [Bacteroides bouchesdurhonensis]